VVNWGWLWSAAPIFLNLKLKNKIMSETASQVEILEEINNMRKVSMMDSYQIKIDGQGGDSASASVNMLFIHRQVVAKKYFETEDTEAKEYFLSIYRNFNKDIRTVIHL
jgi:hypothetical protein